MPLSGDAPFWTMSCLAPSFVDVPRRPVRRTNRRRFREYERFLDERSARIWVLHITARGAEQVREP